MSNTQLTTATFRTNYSRRFPDPLNKVDSSYNIDHFIMLVRALDMPEGLSLAPNPRGQKDKDSGIYREIRESLENKDEPTFHLKNKGITILARMVDISDDKENITVYFAEDDGIADGGHTYKIIQKAKEAETCPDNQYVKIEILTNVPSEQRVDITGGLNTSVQVQDATLLNHDGAFQWIKDEIKGEVYAGKISYRQNDAGEYDIRDLIAFMTIFNVDHPALKGKTPKAAYVSKKVCLDYYEQDQASFENLRPILKDIFALHDYVHLQSRAIYNKNKENGKAGKMIGVFDSREKGGFYFPFSNVHDKYRLHSGTFFPIFGALRYLVEMKDGKYRWKLGSFDAVLKFFDSIAAEMVEASYNTSLIYGRKPNPVGKDENHWNNLFNIVKVTYLQKLVDAA